MKTATEASPMAVLRNVDSGSLSEYEQTLLAVGLDFYNPED